MPASGGALSAGARNVAAREASRHLGLPPWTRPWTLTWASWPGIARRSSPAYIFRRSHLLPASMSGVRGARPRHECGCAPARAVRATRRASGRCEHAACLMPRPVRCRAAPRAPVADARRALRAARCRRSREGVAGGQAAGRGQGLRRGRAAGRRRRAAAAEADRRLGPGARLATRGARANGVARRVAQPNGELSRGPNRPSRAAPLREAAARCECASGVAITSLAALGSRSAPHRAGEVACAQLLTLAICGTGRGLLDQQARPAAAWCCRRGARQKDGAAGRRQAVSRAWRLSISSSEQPTGARYGGEP